jgi:ABC-type glycerol-3-phosphate transport system permease component
VKVSRGWKITGIVILLLYLVWTIGPFYWMVITSFKTNQEIYATQPTLWPNQFVFDHYRDIIIRFNFFLHLRNSIIVAVVTTLIAFVAGTIAAYALTRLNFFGKRPTGLALILSYLVPSSVLFIPLFALLNLIKLVNTLPGLIAADLTLTVPFCTWLLIGYFRTIPSELEDAARVDGCSRVGALIRIVLPLSAPALSVIALFSFTLAWNEFLYAIVLSHSITVMPLTAALSGMQAQDVFFWGLMMAMSVLMAIPPVLIYIAAQRWIIGGLVIGGVKG